jgi:T-complex protein 1 subunit gamma
MRSAAQALEIIPRTLAQNCGAATVKVITELRAKHAASKTGENKNWGIDGEKGVMTDMAELGVWEPLSVKMQTLKTAVESAILLLRVDDVVSGVNKSAKVRQTAPTATQDDGEDARGMDMDQRG